MSQQQMARNGITIEYKLTLDMAKQLCMIENNERGKLCRMYFIIMENTLRSYEDWVNSRNSEKKNANILKTKIGQYASRNLECYDLKAMCAREFNLLNISLTGNTALDIKLKLGYLDKNTREHLNTDINKALDKLQEFDINLLDCNMDFETRKSMIENICNTNYKNIKEEFNKIN